MSRTDTRAHNAKVAKKLTEKDIAAAKAAMQATNWMAQRRATGTAKILEEFRAEIEEARRQGSSWVAITEQLNMHLGLKLNPASVRVHFGEKLSEKEKQTLEQQGLAVGAVEQATPSQTGPETK